MVDKSVGSAGTLRITDDGTTVRYYVLCGDPQTNVGTYRFSINGTAYTTTLPAGFGVKLLAYRKFAASGTATLSKQATGTMGVGGAAPLSVGINRAKPAAPSGLSATRHNEEIQILNWSRKATYTSVVVQRRVDNGAWQQIGIASGNAYTFADVNTSFDHKYDYRVAGRTAAGQSAWSNIATIFTTPAPPTHLVAKRVGNNIEVGLRFDEDGTAWVDSYEIYDGAGLIASGVEYLPWTHVNPNPTVPHTYSMKGVRQGLTSALSAPSNTVQILSAPNAPTGLAPNGAVRPSDEAVRLSWTHNPIDASAQSAYELQYRAVGGSTWTVVSGTTAAFRELALASGSWEWQVRTKGAHPAFSAWSATATTDVVERPGVAITQPDTVWEASVLPVEWSWLQTQGRPQSAWRLELLNAAGDVVESRAGSGAATSATLNRRLTAADWTVRVRAATGDIWSDWAEEAFTVVFDPPGEPALFGEWDESQGGVELTITLSDDPESVPTAAVIVERSHDDGETWDLVVELAQDTVVLDFESVSFGDVRYRATAFTAEGATAVTELAVEARSDAVWLAGGQGFGVTARLPYDPSIQITAGRERALKRYAGRTHPVALTGQALSRTVGISGRTFDRDEATAGVEELVRIAQLETELFLFRDPDGRRIYGAIGDIQLPRQSSTPHPDGWEGVWGYSLTLTEATR